MDQITIYQKPTCSKCRETMELLRSRGVSFDAINYFIDPIPADILRELIEKLGIRPIELFRKKEDKFKDLKIGTSNYSDEELIEILAKYPELIERPIVVRGTKAVLGRPPENVLTLF
ncbi:MAG TPA: arsenate reductase (glutaredoxin) [Candidatus Kapabacteria bacterium]|jgi:arsenate reductase